MTPLPKEVEDGLHWYRIDPEKVRCFPKRDISRGEAWRSIPPEPDNPWRKSHTKNYWVWHRNLRTRPIGDLNKCRD